ncbi:transporter [Bacteroidia bacterium]|nr:transporter [Bacteroidia bacterium]GHU67970.1 transporter [Bacteroidia bacterium]
MEECIQYAVEHNVGIQQIELQKDNAAIDLNTAKMSRLPNLGATVGQTWSSGYGASGIDNANRTENSSSSSFSISSSMPLFTGFRIPNEIAKNKLDLKAAVENLEKAKEDIALNVTSLFLQALFNKELLKVNDEQLKLTQTQVEKTKFLVQAGKSPQSQLYDIEAQAAKDEVSLIQAQNNVALALLDLFQSLELEEYTPFDIAIPANGIETTGYQLQPVSLVYANAVKSKPAVKAQEYRIESAEKTLAIAQSGYWPTLNLGLSYRSSYYYLYNQSNASFTEQFKKRGNEYIGLDLSIPIFNRFSVRNQVRSAKLNISNQQWELENVKKGLYKEIQTAYLNATAAQQKYLASEKAVKASNESFQYAQERYEVGKSSVFEFNEAKNRLIQAQSEQIQAKYDYVFRVKILQFYNGEGL